MSRSKSISHYPARYQEIVEECAMHNKEIRVACETIQQANSFKGHWFSFIGALRAEEKRVKAEIARAQLPLPTDHQTTVLNLGAWSQRVMLTLINSPPTVVFQNREHSWQAQIVAKAIVTEGKPVELPHAVTEAAGRLMAMQAAITKEEDDGKNS